MTVVSLYGGETCCSEEITNTIAVSSKTLHRSDAELIQNSGVSLLPLVFHFPQVEKKKKNLLLRSILNRLFSLSVSLFNWLIDVMVAQRGRDRFKRYPSGRSGGNTQHKSATLHFVLLILSSPINVFLPQTLNFLTGHFLINALLSPQ